MSYVLTQHKKFHIEGKIPMELKMFKLREILKPASLRVMEQLK